jgi:hypothetical protein
MYIDKCSANQKPCQPIWISKENIAIISGNKMKNIQLKHDRKSSKIQQKELYDVFIGRDTFHKEIYKNNKVTILTFKLLSFPHFDAKYDGYL